MKGGGPQAPTLFPNCLQDMAQPASIAAIKNQCQSYPETTFRAEQFPILSNGEAFSHESIYFDRDSSSKKSMDHFFLAIFFLVADGSSAKDIPCRHNFGRTI